MYPPRSKRSKINITRLKRLQEASTLDSPIEVGLEELDRHWHLDMEYLIDMQNNPCHRSLNGTIRNESLDPIFVVVTLLEDSQGDLVPTDELLTRIKVGTANDNFQDSFISRKCSLWSVAISSFICFPFR